MKSSTYEVHYIDNIHDVLSDRDPSVDLQQIWQLCISDEYHITQTSARGTVKMSTEKVSMVALKDVVLEIDTAKRCLSRILFGDDVPPELRDA